MARLTLGNVVLSSYLLTINGLAILTPIEDDRRRKISKVFKLAIEFAEEENVRRESRLNFVCKCERCFSRCFSNCWFFLINDNSRNLKKIVIFFIHTNGRNDSWYFSRLFDAFIRVSIDHKTARIELVTILDSNVYFSPSRVLVEFHRLSFIRAKLRNAFSFVCNANDELRRLGDSNWPIFHVSISRRLFPVWLVEVLVRLVGTKTFRSDDARLVDARDHATTRRHESPVNSRVRL